MFLEQFSGVFALLFFVSTIFEYSGSSVSPNESSIIVGVIQLIGAYCSTCFVDKAGRRFLISTSAFGISFGMFVFALYSFLNDHGYVGSHLNWIPLASFSFVLWIANLGVLTLPFLVMSELMITLPNVCTQVSVERVSKPVHPLPLSLFHGKHKIKAKHFRLIIISDKKLHLHILPVPFMDFCLRTIEVLANND